VVVGAEFSWYYKTNVGLKRATLYRTYVRGAQFFFFRKVGCTQNYWRRKGNIKQVSFWGPTNIRRHRSKFSSYDDRAPFGNPCRMCCVMPFGILAFPGTISHFVVSQTDVMARRQFSPESLTIISLWYFVPVSGISCDAVCIWKQRCRYSLASVEDSVTR
jgi:hypothetical protein